MLLVAHTGRAAARRTGRAVADRLIAAGITIRILEPEAADLGYPPSAAIPAVPPAPGVPPAPAVPPAPGAAAMPGVPSVAVVPASPAAAAGTEMVVVIGGDGTLLRAAELARGAGVPLLGVNLGHVGFLAEAEPEDLSEAVEQVVAREYSVEERMTVDVDVRVNGSVIARTWALNEATIEKTARERMVDLVIEVDGRPLSRFGCDGVVFATPTGSTAYAFSAGGPVVWPEVEAVLMVPICAHALFARPMVVSPRSVLAAELVAGIGQSEVPGAVLWCDGRRMVELPPGSRVEVRRGTRSVLLARLRAGGGSAAAGQVGAPFTGRLVEKFGLPVTGWRGRAGR
ncbi:MAG: NAD kinase [Streptosporangiaceae bacterium]